MVNKLQQSLNTFLDGQMETAVGECNAALSLASIAAGKVNSCIRKATNFEVTVKEVKRNAARLFD